MDEWEKRIREKVWASKILSPGEWVYLVDLFCMARDHADCVPADVRTEREVIANKARQFAGHYPEASDGRNTFILLAEWIEARATNLADA